MPNRRLVLLLLPFLLACPLASASTNYICTIKNVSKMNANGYFVRHGWSANYLNREFTVDGESGKVLNTTALKQRLSNFNSTNQPVIINKENPAAPFRVFTKFADKGTYTLLEIGSNEASGKSMEKPYFYITDIGMILSGTCIEENKP